MSQRIVVMVIAFVCLLADEASAEAQLWINDDKPQSDGLRYAPA